MGLQLDCSLKFIKYKDMDSNFLYVNIFSFYGKNWLKSSSSKLVHLFVLLDKDHKHDFISQ